MSFQVDITDFRYDKAEVLKRVQLEIRSGAVTAVLGASGSGKSTLLGLLGLLLHSRKNGVAISYCGERYDGMTAFRQDELRRKHFGFVLQTSYLLPNFTCRYNVELPLTLKGHSPSVRASQLQRLLTQIDGCDELAAILDSRPARISVGQRQRIAVLRALIHDPDVVFADEPSASLDSANAKAIWDLLLRWQRGDLRIDASASANGGSSAADGNPTSSIVDLPAAVRSPETSMNGKPRDRTLIIVTHDVALARRTASRFVWIRDGVAHDDASLMTADFPEMAR